MDLYTVYDYPPLPDHIEQQCLDIAAADTPLFTVDNVPGQCVFDLFYPPADLEQWKQTQSPFGPDYFIFVQKMHSGHCLLPHVDQGDAVNNICPRDYAINYLLSSKGPVTEWYQEPDVSTMIKSVVFPARTWHRIKTDVFHGVRNITEPRIAITMTPMSGHAGNKTMSKRMLCS